MKIHSDILTTRDVYAATSAAGMRGVTAERLEEHGSRSRARSFDVTLRGNSTRKPNPGTGGRYFDEGEYAATWDEWGMFIHALYEADPKALIGDYGPRHVFEQATRLRFEELTAKDACRNHVWKSGGPMMRECKRCQALHDYGPIHEQYRAKAKAA